MIQGFGCWLFPDDHTSTKTIGNVKVHSLCAPFGQMSHEIFKSCMVHSPDTTKYARKVTRLIKRQIEDKDTEHVFLLGHSFGGYVCSMVTQSLADHPYAHKLSIITYATIMPVDPSTCSRIHIQQYVYKGDISEKCIGSKNKFVTWLRNPTKKSMFNPVTSHLKYPFKHTIDELVKRLNSS